MTITAFPSGASNDFITGRKPLITPCGADDTVSVRYSLDLAAADVATQHYGGVIGFLPARCVPVALVIDSDDLDSGSPAIAIDVGLGAVNETTGAYTDTAIDTNTISGGAAWKTGDTTAQAGGATAIVSKALMRVQPSNWDRKILLDVSTAAATGQAGTIGVTLTYRSA